MFEKNKNQQLFYDEYNAVRFIASETGIDKSIIRSVLNSEMRYMASVGIVDSDGLEEYLGELNSDLECKNRKEKVPSLWQGLFFYFREKCISFYERSV